MARIVFFSASAPVGGHLRSALTIAEELSCRGHEIFFIAGFGPGNKLLKNANFETFLMPFPPTKSLDFNWKNYQALKKYIIKKTPHIIHTFLKGIPQLTLIAKKSGSKLVATIAGGRPPKVFPRITPVTVFSHELKNTLLFLGFPESYIYVIPGRMNFDIPRRDNDVDSFLERLGFKSDVFPVVMMICRAEERKRNALASFFAAAENFGRKQTGGAFIHIGSGNDAYMDRNVREKAVAVNASVGRQILASTEYGSDQPMKYLHLADYCVGMGRSAFDSMAMGKPTLILSNEGFGGIISSENVSLLAKYNFTARFRLGWQETPEEPSNQLADCIEAMVQNPVIAKRSAEFAHSYCVEHLDVRKAVDSYEEVYFGEGLNKFILPNSHELLKALFREITRTIWYSAKK